MLNSFYQEFDRPSKTHQLDGNSPELVPQVRANEIPQPVKRTIQVQRNL